MMRAYDPQRDIVPAIPVKNLVTVPDYMREAAATRLAARIDGFWRERGFPQVKHWVTEGAAKSAGHIYCIRGNLVGGLPPRDVPEETQTSGSPKKKARGQ